jgi:hypothetical protein
VVQAGPLKVGGVADVVEVGCGDQVVAVFTVEDRSDAAGALADGSDVVPSIAQCREQVFSLAGGPLFNRHAGTIPAERMRRPQWLLRAAAARLSI